MSSSISSSNQNIEILNYWPTLVSLACLAIMLTVYGLLAPEENIIPEDPLVCKNTAMVNQYKQVRPLFGDMKLRYSDIIIMGDSRTANDIRTDIVEKGIGKSVALYSAPLTDGGQLNILLGKILDNSYRSKIIIVCFSPLGLFTPQSENHMEVSEWELWRSVFDMTLNQFVHNLKSKFIRSFSMRSGYDKDENTNLYFSMYKYENHFYPDKYDEKDANKIYKDLLSRNQAERTEAFESFKNNIIAVNKNNLKIICTRLPVSKSIREEENKQFNFENLISFLKKNNIEYLDFSHANYPTYDGSHLDYHQSVEFSKEFATALIELLNK